MIAKKPFTGVINGEEKRFSAGDKITPAEAKALGLAKKPDLVEQPKPKE